MPLIFLIAKVLDEKLREKIVYHKKLVERLKEEGKLTQTAFISLNYDIIIDNILTGLYPDFHINYRIEFINFNMLMIGKGLTKIKIKFKKFKS